MAIAMMLMLSAALGSAAPGSSAQGSSDTGATEVLPPASFIYIAAGATSDDRFDGMSRSDGKPAPDLTLYYGRADGLFAGTVISSTNYGDFHGPDAEIDLFGGKHIQLDKTELTFEGLYSAFAGETGRQPSYDFFEAQAAASRTLGGIKWTANLAYSPSYSYDGGRAWDLRGTAAYPISRWLTFSASLGRLTVQRSQDHSYGDVGATATWRRVSLDLRYVTTVLIFAES